MVINPNLNPEERERQSLQKEEYYVTLTKGRYKVAVKVIDIFGNDTTKVIEMKL
ncbi:MAG: hypothetical protein LBP92_10375 [Deltaproteobacteria bacterium]|nr:hypothetical protein [Deltaproteobacteria bacterium]